MKAVLHIGIGKAGSSSIQNFLNLNRIYLNGLKINYPYDIIQGNRHGGDNNKCLAAICTPFDKEHILFRQQRVKNLKDYVAFKRYVVSSYKHQLEILGEDETCILSAEHFWSMLTSEKQVESLSKNLNLIGIYSPKIVIYIREQTAWLKSFILQKIIEGSATNFELPFKDKDQLFNRLNYHATIQLWRKFFPCSDLEVRIFDKKEFYKNDLIIDFFNACSIPQSTLSKISHSSHFESNASDMSIEGYSLLAFFNKNAVFLPGYTEKRKFLIEKMKKKYVGKPSGFFSIEQCDYIKDLFFASNEYVRRDYFPNKQKLFEKDDNQLLGSVKDLNSNDVLKELYCSILMG